MKKNILFVSAFLTLITGCSSIHLLPEPHEIRYFKSEAIGKCPRMKLGISHLSSSSLIVDSLFVDWQFDESYLDIPLQVIAKDDRDGYLIKKLKRSWEYIQSSRDEIDFYQVPLTALEKCTISEEAYKEKKRKQKAAQKAAAKKAAEKKAKEEKEKAEKKRKIEQQAAEKNNEVIKKYGKPYCNPFKVRTEDDTHTPYILGASNMAGGTFAGRKKNCLFTEVFRISQVTPYGMLVYNSERVCERGDLFMPPYCYDKEKGPYFVIPNEEDKELVDGDNIGGLFEYIGTQSYETILRAPKTVLKFKHISK